MFEKQIRYSREQLYSMRPPLEERLYEKTFSEWAKGVATLERKVIQRGKGRGLAVLLASNPGIKGFSAGRGKPESVSSASSCGPISSLGDSPMIEASQPPMSSSSTFGSETPPTPPRADGLNPNAISFNPTDEKKLAASMAYLSARPRVPTAMRHGYPQPGYPRSARAPPPTCMQQQGFCSGSTQRVRSNQYGSYGYPPYSSGYGTYRSAPPTAINLSGI